MKISTKIANDFATLMSEEGNTEEKKYTFVYGTVKKSGNDLAVKFDGSDVYTPVESSTELNDGDRVEVMIRDHRAIVSSNFTSKSVGTTRFDSFETKINDDISEVKKTQQESNTDYSDFKTAQEEFQKNQNEFNTARSYFEKAQSEFNKSYATEIKNIKSTYVQTTYLESYYTKTSYLDANYVKTSYLDANYVKTKDLDAKYATIEYLKSGSAYVVGNITALDLQAYGALKLGTLDGEDFQYAVNRTAVGTGDLGVNNSFAFGSPRIACEVRGKILFLRSGNNYIVFENKAFRPDLDNGNYIALGSSDEEEGLDGSVNRRCRWGTLYTTQSPNISSVASMKKNIRPLKTALKDILDTDVFSYNLKADLKDGINSKKYGFVIGDGYKISDKVLHSSKDGIDLYNACGLAFRAIQELYEMIQNGKETANDERENTSYEKERIC